MKVTKKQLTKLIQEAILKETSDFTARRRLISAARDAAFNFEDTVRDIFQIENPDSFGPDIQANYQRVVSQLEKEITQAALRAAGSLIAFPRVKKDAK